MCHFSSYWGGGVPAILEKIYVFLWHESEAQDLSAHCNKKVFSTVSTLFNTWVRFMSFFTVHSSGFSRGKIAPGTSSSFSFTFLCFFLSSPPRYISFSCPSCFGPYIPSWIVYEANFAGKKFCKGLQSNEKFLRAKNHQPPPSTSLTFLIVLCLKELQLVMRTRYWDDPTKGSCQGTKEFVA